MTDFKVVLPTTTEEWQRDMNIAYNQALEDVLKLIATLGIDWEVKNSDIEWLEKSIQGLRK